MEIKNMTTDQLLERRSAIAAEVDTEGADLTALEDEVRAINEELEARKAAEAKKAEIRKAVGNGAGRVVATVPAEGRKATMTVDEVRASREYIDAYANYIKSGSDKECRALLSTNSNVAANPGQVPVPTIVEDRVRTAWEKNGILELVKKTYVKGNLQVGFELSATGAVVHEEGTDAPAEEVLTFGVVTLVPESIKKWIRISDEALDLSGEAFLDYIYDEITYQIAKKTKQLLIGAITTAGTTTTATAIGVPQITGAPALDLVAKAIANLSDEADNITVVMNRLTYADFVTAIAANGFLFNPFEGVRVEYDNTLPAYASASAGDVWMIAGDFSGAQMNFPNGQEIRLKFDDLTEAQSDLVKIVGRMFVAIGITELGHFVNIVKGN